MAFLRSCKAFDVFPNFHQFRLYKKCLRNNDMYKSFQCEILDNELKSRQRVERRFKTEVESTKNKLREVVSRIDFLCSSSYLSREVGKLRRKTSAIHGRDGKWKTCWHYRGLLLRLTHQELS